MTMTPQTEPTTAMPGGVLGPAKIIYALYILGLFIPLTALGGLIYAYIARGDDEVLDTHLSFAIRTFWWGLVMIVIGTILAAVMVGYLILLIWVIWVLTRCISGLRLAGKNAPITSVGTFGFLAS